MVWVVSPSKLCNLRCTYCYEWNELGNPVRMSSALLRQILVNVRDYHLTLEHRFGYAFSNISWLGGEPLILPVDYLEEIMALEHEVFGDLLSRGAIYNVVQSNLYRLGDEHLEFLLRHHWKVGVSLDVKPGVRRSLTGRDTEQRVIANVQRLRARGIQPDAIAVLAGHTVDHLNEVYDFFAAQQFTRIRILPLFSGPPERPLETILVPNDAMAKALCGLFEHWLLTGSQVAVEPLTSYLGTVARKILGVHGRLIDRSVDGESVLVVNTNGEVYQVADAYEPGKAMGNVGTEAFADIIQSEPTRLGRTRDTERTAAMCGPCSFAGFCSGAPAFESPREGTDEGRCQIHHRVHQFIEGYLRNAGIDEAGLRALLTSLEPVATDARSAT
ncbi:MAG: radical SAM protein [Myxococcota bacterium]|nr:radical SAM protein [Myxococcota bacterium]